MEFGEGVREEAVCLALGQLQTFRWATDDHKRIVSYCVHMALNGTSKYPTFQPGRVRYDVASLGSDPRLIK